MRTEGGHRPDEHAAREGRDAIDRLSAEGGLDDVAVIAARGGRYPTVISTSDREAPPGAHEAAVARVAAVVHKVLGPMDRLRRGVADRQMAPRLGRARNRWPD